jgi:uncharacterized damage-inducible protein DinB
MENLDQKADFLRNKYTGILTGLEPDTPPRWGKMNVQQMVEHMADYVRVASGKTLLDVVSPEKVARSRNFLESEKQFPENTPNALMAEEPKPVKLDNLEQAIDELVIELDHFFAVHELEENRTTVNPFFGDLVYEQQVQLLYKHATHHLRQFGLDY